MQGLYEESVTKNTDNETSPESNENTNQVLVSLLYLGGGFAALMFLGTIMVSGVQLDTSSGEQPQNYISLEMFEKYGLYLAY